MPEQDQVAGATVEETPTPEVDAEVDAPEDVDPLLVGEGADVVSRLQGAYREGQKPRRKVIPIAPGKYADLAARFKPVDWEFRRKLIRRAERRGETGPETDLSINSRLMADACETMLFRPAPGKPYAELHTLIGAYKADEPIRFDERLAHILGIRLVGGETEAHICRLVFGAMGVFETHYMVLNTWSLQAVEDDEDAEEDEGDVRPT